MCGIVGALHLDDEPVSESFLQRALELIHHRGPDEQGWMQAGPIGIAHVRLKIIDLVTGKQPFVNEDGTVWLVLSGEIYNYPDLRQRLLKAGHTFASKSDAEVALHLYEEEGVDFLKSLRGMFGLAIWDAREQLLLLARDRLGIQPLHYHWKEAKRLIFASECKSLFCHPSLETREINPSSVMKYLLFRYVPSPQTLYKDIRKLPPGHLLTLQRGKLTVRPYWELPEKQPDPATRSRGMAMGQSQREELLHALKEAVKIHLRSDVPAGILLSGGVDSTILVALAHHLQIPTIRTYSIGFPEPHYDESEDAKRVSLQFETEHKTDSMDPKRFFDDLPTLIRFRDAPLSEASEVPLHRIVSLASSEVKVLLSGQGADELFGGYLKYIVDPKIQALQERLFPSGRILLQLAQKLLPGRSRRLQKLLTYAQIEQKLERWIAYFASWIPAEFRSLSHGTGNETFLYEELVRELRSILEQSSLSAPIDQMMLLDLKFYLPDDLLEGGDRMHMAASVEGRAPYLDHPLVEHVWKLPGKAKINGMDTKRILKSAVKDLVPPGMLKRRKNGFTVPFGDWLRNSLKENGEEILLPSSAFHRDFLPPGVVPKIWKEHQAGLYDHSKTLWTLINLELWHLVHCNQG